VYISNEAASFASLRELKNHAGLDSRGKFGDIIESTFFVVGTTEYTVFFVGISQSAGVIQTSVVTAY